jgi:serine phosphatase RsbU (regulator of sigma subunit)
MRRLNLLSGNSLQTDMSSLLSINKFGIVEIGNKEAETKSNETEASIRYSRTIQGSIMSGEANLYKSFPESFLIDLPKDIVSGDFFWMKEVGNKTVIIVGDCTGHGVPAALLSVLGISLLNQIIIEEEITDPSMILQKLSIRLKKTFHNSNYLNGMYSEGMDLAVCTIDFDSKTIAFEGALRPAYIISEKQLNIIKGSRNSITGDNSHAYSTKIYNFKKGDILYLFSDGFADQFGGAKNKKLLIKRFQNILIDISNSSMGRQMMILEQVFSNWKSGMEQTDDVMITGIKL